MHRLLRFSVLILAAVPALADEAPILAQYATNSGSLPPEYAWETTLTLYEDGMIEVKHCRGYETEGDACKSATGQVEARQREAIRAAALASGLLDDPAEGPEEIMVGGGLTWGAVFLDGRRVDLPASVAAADADRVASVLRSIADAVPVDLLPLMSGD